LERSTETLQHWNIWHHDWFVSFLISRYFIIKRTYTLRADDRFPWQMGDGGWDTSYSDCKSTWYTCIPRICFRIDSAPWGEQTRRSCNTPRRYSCSEKLLGIGSENVRHSLSGFIIKLRLHALFKKTHWKIKSFKAFFCDTLFIIVNKYVVHLTIFILRWIFDAMFAQTWTSSDFHIGIPFGKHQVMLSTL